MGTKENLKDKESWLRGLYILLFGLLYSIAEIVLWAIVLFQFGSRLITGRLNERVLDFTRGLNAYIYLILQYLAFRSDDKPYPFDEWPGEGLGDAEKSTAADPRAITADRDFVERDDEGETETGV